MKKYELGLTISVLLTFTLTMIIIFTGVFINFFSIEDFTIIAALIGVIAAVVGGVISGGLTLLGVRYTIKHENDIRMKDQIPQKIELIRKSETTINEILQKINGSPKFNFGNYETNKEILFEDASKIDHECYNQLIKIEKIKKQFNEDSWFMYLEEDENGGKMTYTTKTREIYESFKQELKNYEEILSKKIMYYLNKISD